MNGTIASGLPEAEERALIAASLDMIERVIGTRPRGWMSIARSQSFNTPRLLAEAGFVYMCDWVNDELPYRFATRSEEHTSELQSLMRISYDVFCFKKKTYMKLHPHHNETD